MHFIEESHAISKVMLESLSDSLGLSGDERFEAFHHSNAPSTSTAVLQYYPLTDLPQNTSVGHFTHTDTGSLTTLFNSDWGLQVYSSQRDSWEYIAPREDHAIINVGDAL
jgi:isopenicillin N synthase-like dioxygenase